MRSSKDKPSPVKTKITSNGLRLRELRLRKMMTQQALADFLGIRQSAVLKYESGRVVPPPDKLAKLAELFGVTTDYLLGRSDRAAVPDVAEQFMLEGAQAEVVGAFKKAYARAAHDHTQLTRLKAMLDRFGSE